MNCSDNQLNTTFCRKKAIEHASLSISIVRGSFKDSAPTSRAPGPVHTNGRILLFCDSTTRLAAAYDVHCSLQSLHRPSLNLWQCFQLSILHCGCWQLSILHCGCPWTLILHCGCPWTLILHCGCLQLLYMAFSAHSNNVATGYNDLYIAPPLP